MLSVEALRSGYTAIDVLKGVSLRVPDRAIIGVLGPNGAGKTALLRAISGLNPVRDGRITFDARELGGASPDAIVRQGVIHVPQGRMLFGPMTVRENLELGAYMQTDRTALQQRMELVHRMFPILNERSGQPAAYLSGGEQQMLALGRALMGNPKLLLLDEPSLGLAPKVFDTIIDRVARDSRSGRVDPDRRAERAQGAAHRRSLLRAGEWQRRLRRPSAELLRDARIERTYLGAGH